MFTVALIGPDGAGKSTIARKIAETIPAPVKYMYLGVNREAGTHLLFTTRLAQALRAGGRSESSTTSRVGDPGGDISHPTSGHRRGFRGALRGVRSILGLINRLVEESYQYGLAAIYRRRGYVVLTDRDYYCDYYATDIAPGNPRRPLLRRIHGFALRRIFPRPELVILLDAPAEVLFRRKGEWTVEYLERRRQDYLALQTHFRHFQRINVDRPLEESLQEASDTILRHYAALGGVKSRPKPGSQR